MSIFKKKEKKQESDNELIEKYRNSRDKEYVGVLFERYYFLVYGLCLKYLQDEDEAKDAVLQIFEKLFTDLFKHNIQNFPSWLHSVARNHCLMNLRKKKQIEKHEQILRFEKEQFHEQPDFEEKLIETQRMNGLNEALAELKEEQRVCIDLFYLQEKSYNEICDTTGYNYKQVKSFIQNGKRNLKLHIEQNDGRK